MPVVVLYEDSVQRGTGRFPLHELFVRCVIDDVRDETWEFRARFVARPRRGSAKVRAACCDDEGAATFNAAPLGVVAVYDRDHLHDLLSCRPGLCKKNAKTALREECVDPTRFFPCFLEHNVETLVTTLATVHADLVGRLTFEAAVKRKVLSARDDVFVAAARKEALAVRYTLRTHVPSFDYVVRTLIRLGAAPDA